MTILFVAITILISLLAFNNNDLFRKLQFNPYQVYHRKEYYRLLTHGFIHADWVHLAINMFVLYQFGKNIEGIFDSLGDQGFMHYPKIWFSFFYLSSIVVASLTTLKKHRDHIWYNAVGASGGVSAILFCFIFFCPFETLSLYGIIPLPGIIMGILYLIYSQYMSRRDKDHINHDAHFVGAVYGFLFPLLIHYQLIWIFLNQILHIFNQ
jgi:membrane associated rhomboid family serine protease